MGVLGCFVASLFLFSLFSKSLNRTLLTAPMLFTAAGVVTAALDIGDRDSGVRLGGFLHGAELGLVLLLFTEASKTSLAVLRRLGSLPTRLLSLGMLLTILLAGGAALLVLPGISLWQAAILAAIVAPTDAGLGQVVVTDKRVPARVRHTLAVEAVLNDGLAVPFLLCFLGHFGAGERSGDPRLMRYIVEQLGLGALLGAAIGLGGGVLLGVARSRGWMATPQRALGFLALPLLCVLLSPPLGASMFIAAFVGGLCVQIGYGAHATESSSLSEEAGQVLNLLVFFLFGLVVARAWSHLNWTHAAFAVLSLTLVRIVPVALSLRGTGLSRATVLFMGWFGPRGLASIVLCLVYLEEAGRSTPPSPITLAAIATVLLSVVAHGASARPLIAAYARHVSRLGPDAPEHGKAGASPTSQDVERVTNRSPSRTDTTP
jgi:sodium/hydrogen antiporter